MKKFYQHQSARSSQGQQRLNNLKREELHHLNTDEKDFLIGACELVMEQSADTLHKMYQHYKDDDYEALVADSQNYHEAVSVLDEPKFNQLLIRIENEPSSAQHVKQFLPLLKELKTISQCMKDELKGGITMLEHRLDHEEEAY